MMPTQTLPAIQHCHWSHTHLCGVKLTTLLKTDTVVTPDAAVTTEATVTSDAAVTPNTAGADLGGVTGVAGGAPPPPPPPPPKSF